MRRRDRLAVVLALMLLVIGAAGLAAFGTWVYHRHSADLAALHGDPSYRYGRNLDPSSLPGANVRSAYRGCVRELTGRHPFAGFSVDKAVAGCVDAWQARND